MYIVSQEEFERLVGQAIDAIPDGYAKNIKNLAFVVEDLPTPEQRVKLNLHPNESLFGLYEGVPLTRRSGGYNLVLPDKITIFKRPMEMSVNSLPDLKAQIKHTIWHEVAHYYGLDHARIHELEDK